MEEGEGESRKRIHQDESYEELDSPNFRSTSMPLPKKSRHSLGELSLSAFKQESNLYRDGEIDIAALEEMFEAQGKSNLRQQGDDQDEEVAYYSGNDCSWLHQQNLRKDQFLEYIDSKANRREQFDQPTVTPFLSSRQIRMTPVSSPPPASPISQASRSLAHSTPQSNASLRSLGSNSLTGGSQALNESRVSEERLSLSLITLVEESSDLDSTRIRRHIPRKPENAFDVSDGAILPSFSPRVISWNKRLNYLTFQWETGIAVWSPSRDEVKIVPLTTDIGYECMIKLMAWNHSFTTLAMVSCKGDLMLWNPLTNKKARGRPLPEATIKLVVWKAFVPEREDKETLYIMTRQGLFFEFKVVSTKVEPLRCVKTCLKDPLHLTISPDNKYVTCSDSKGTIGFWKTVATEGSVVENFRHKKNFGELHSWCPWMSDTLVFGKDNEKVLKIYNLMEKKIVNCVSTDAIVASVTWSKDFKELITAEGNHLVCRTFPGMEMVMRVDVRQPVVFLDVREEEESSLIAFSNEALVSLWRCFDLEDSRHQFPNDKALARRQARKIVRFEESFLDIDGYLVR